MNYLCHTLYDYDKKIYNGISFVCYVNGSWIETVTLTENEREVEEPEMQWDMREEHSIYDKQKEQLLNNLCDIFDNVIEPLHHFGTMRYEGYCVDVFETDGRDYDVTIKNAIKCYRDVCMNERVRQKDEERIDKGIFESKLIGIMDMENIIRNFIPVETYTKTILENRQLNEDAKSRCQGAYEEGLQKVLSELHCLGDDPVECYEVTKGINSSDDILPKTYFGLIFSAQYFVC